MLSGRLPRGALAACLFVALVHLVVSIWVFPRPVAHESLRRKIMVLTEHERPALLIAGDSRAESQVIPEVVAVGTGMSSGEVVNIAERSCEPSAVLAAYAEFADRFAPAPLMLLSVSIFSVNDGANDPRCLHDELLWSLGLRDRLRLVPLKRVVQAAFLAERECAQRIAAWYHGRRPLTLSQRGFVSVAEDQRLDPASEHMQRGLAYLKRYWYCAAALQGIRRRQLEADLRQLLHAGVQVVILDSPEHPAFARAIAGTEMGAANAAFHRQLAELCAELDIPILRYDDTWLAGRDPDALYCDPMHLNRRGAALLSERIAQDLIPLLRRLRRGP